MGKTCCFIGHSDTPSSVYPHLLEAVEKLITSRQVTDFLAGNYGSFDRMAVRAVKEMKMKYPGISIYIMLPYLPEPGKEPNVPQNTDGLIYPEGLEKVPYKVAIPRLNRIMVDDADFAIAYVKHSWGGAHTTLEYAQKKEKKGKMEIDLLA